MEWRDRAACRDDRPEVMFPIRSGEEAKVARDVCRRKCPVQLECLAYALDRGEQFGVWGGKTARERRAILKANPRVTDWDRLLVRRPA